MLQTNFGYYPSIITVGDDVQRVFFLFLALAASELGQSN
jgi:hypothetical protein